MAEEGVALPQRRPRRRERSHATPVAHDGSEAVTAVGLGRAGGDGGQPRAEDMRDRDEAGEASEASDAAASVAAEMERVNEWFGAQLAAASSQGGQVLLRVPFLCLYVVWHRCPLNPRVPSCMCVRVPDARARRRARPGREDAGRGCCRAGICAPRREGAGRRRRG